MYPARSGSNRYSASTILRTVSVSAETLPVFRFGPGSPPVSNPRYFQMAIGFPQREFRRSRPPCPVDMVSAAGLFMEGSLGSSGPPPSPVLFHFHQYIP